MLCPTPFKSHAGEKWLVIAYPLSSTLLHKVLYMILICNKYSHSGRLIELGESCTILVLACYQN